MARNSILKMFLGSLATGDALSSYDIGLAQAQKRAQLAQAKQSFEERVKQQKILNDIQNRKLGIDMQNVDARNRGLRLGEDTLGFNREKEMNEENWRKGTETRMSASKARTPMGVKQVFSGADPTEAESNAKIKEAQRIEQYKHNLALSRQRERASTAADPMKFNQSMARAGFQGLLSSQREEQPSPAKIQRWAELFLGLGGGAPPSQTPQARPGQMFEQPIGPGLPQQNPLPQQSPVDIRTRLKERTQELMIQQGLSEDDAADMALEEMGM